MVNSQNFFYGTICLGFLCLGLVVTKQQQDIQKISGDVQVISSVVDKINIKIEDLLKLSIKELSQIKVEKVRG